MKELIPAKLIENKIYLIRGKKVMLDIDLSLLYGVETKSLNQAVRRNIKRFPTDFMFKLNMAELQNLRSQFVTAKYSMRRFPPYAFTEQGVAMLSSVLNSERAVQVNIMIMRIFVRIREMVATHKKLADKINELELKYDKHDSEIQSIFAAIRQLMEPPERPKRRIGFRV